MANINDEWMGSDLRRRVNDGTATDEDFDYLASNNEFNPSLLGPGGRKEYDKAKERLQLKKASGTVNSDKLEEPTFNMSRDEYIDAIGEDNAIKALRASNPDDNDAYRKALRDNDLSVDNKKGKISSIMDAYYGGTLDKGSRDYMIANSLATFARNLGRDIGNVGAQYSGGTIDNNRDKALWDTRNEELFANSITGEKASQEGTEAEMKRKQDTANLTTTRLGNEKVDRSLGGARLMGSYKDASSKAANGYRAQAQDIRDGKAAGTMEDITKLEEKAVAMETIAGEFALLESASTSSVDTEEHVANLLAGVAKAVTTGVVNEEEADKMKQDIKNFAASGPTINIGSGSERKAGEDKGLGNYVSDVKNAKGLGQTVSALKGQAQNFGEWDMGDDAPYSFAKVGKNAIYANLGWVLNGKGEPNYTKDDKAGREFEEWLMKHNYKKLARTGVNDTENYTVEDIMPLMREYQSGAPVRQ